jgi:hypothetical protein
MEDKVQVTGAGPGEKKRRYGWLIFILGLVLGSVATVGIVQRAIPYLRLSVFDRGVSVEGTVLRKQVAEGELRLRISSSEGVMLATFTQNLDEIELLVEEGDLVGLSIPQYTPFVQDPDIQRVRKPEVSTGGHLPAAEPQEVEGNAPEGRLEVEESPAESVPATTSEDAESKAPTEKASER